MNPFVVHIDDVEEIEGAYVLLRWEKLSSIRDIGRAAGSKNVGFSWERLLPDGERASRMPTRRKRSSSSFSRARVTFA